MKLALLLLSSCAAYIATKTGTATIAAKSEQCDFAVASAPPADLAAQYVEVGVVDAWIGPYASPPTTIAGFKQKSRKEVCGLGGDLVIPEVNGFNMYIRGTVYARTSAPPTPAPIAATPGTPAPADPAHAEPCAAGTPSAPHCQAQCDAQKNAAACHQTASWLETGTNTTKNMSLAKKYYRQACELGQKNDCRRGDLLESKGF